MNPDTECKNKIIIQGKIRTDSPLHIGSGSGKRSDLDILLDRKGNPFIPATAFIGSLKHAIKSREKDFDKNARQFWGFTEDKSAMQSAIRCADLMMKNPAKPVIRDGIRIDNKSGMVLHKGKYDYEVLEQGAVFHLNMEIDCLPSEGDFPKRMAATIYSLLQKGKLQLGAKSNSGLGKCSLMEKDTKILFFDFTDKPDVFYWLTRNFSAKKPMSVSALGKIFDIPQNNFRMDLTMELKNSLIIRSYPKRPELPDAVHLHSGGEPVLTGTSLKGAIRARAERICKTLGINKDFAENLFGIVVENDENSRAKKGKVVIHEIIMPRFVAELQNRIKIDRFTGGTIQSALFDSMPMFRDDTDKVMNMILEIRQCTEAEAGLILLVLKDIWTGDIAVGGEKNVGRGVFQGLGAFIEWDDKKYMLDKNIRQTKQEDRQQLQKFVDTFISEAGS